MLYQILKQNKLWPILPLNILRKSVRQSPSGFSSILWTSIISRNLEPENWSNNKNKYWLLVLISQHNSSSLRKRQDTDLHECMVQAYKLAAIILDILHYFSMLLFEIVQINNILEGIQNFSLDVVLSIWSKDTTAYRYRLVPWP